MNLDFTGSTLFLVLLLFAVGLICIIKGGDLFVDAAAWIAEASGIPKFIIGATVVSFATTMPEMLVSVFSALEGNADIAIGNAVGIIRLQIDRAGEHGARKLSIGGDGILQVPEQKLKIGAIGNADIRNGLQRFWYIAACGRLHAASFPVGFRLGYTVWWRSAALS